MAAILFVCTANICRSPIAAELFKRVSDQVDKNTRWIVDSAGTWTVEGMPATEKAIDVLRRIGLDITKHRSTDVTRLDLKNYDLILTMESGHKEALIFENPQRADRIFMLSEMVDSMYDIPDPIGGTIQDFQDTVKLLEDIISRGYPKINIFSSHNKTNN